MKTHVDLSGKLALVLMTLLSLGVYAQQPEENGSSERTGGTATFNFGGDLVSRYIWRGTDYGNSPAVQPSVSFSAGGFRAGFWGSYGLGQYSKKVNDTTIENMGHYAEFDVYVSYTWKEITLMATDYFFPNPLNANSGNKYFNFNKDMTGHGIELSLSWAGTQKFPMQLFAGTVVYGADKDKNADGVYGLGPNNNYSTYFEAGYQFYLKGFGVKPFAGGIPYGSAWYGNYGGVVTAGLTVSRTITIAKKFSMPVYGSVITNPQAESVFLVFGVTINSDMDK